MAKKTPSTNRRGSSSKSKSNSGKSNYKKRLVIIALKALGAFILSLAIFLFFVYLGLFGKLPNKEELLQIENDVASEVYSIKGTLMGKYYYQNRMSIENKVISKHAVNALVATEDKRFFQHEGFDIVSLGRVVFKTVLLGNKSQGGGSTISQQLAKNLYPRKKYGPFSMLVNKSREIFIASRLEDTYSKDQILNLYLNTVPFSEDVYGIEAASLRFFDKHSSDLFPKEAAVLIGMLAANTAYNPRINPSKSLNRRNVVLKRMEEFGFLSKEEYQKYSKEDLGLKYRKLDHNTGVAPYFREVVRKKVQEILEEKFGEYYDIYADGLKIYTTIDPTLQKYADEAVQKHMANLQKEFKNHWMNKDPWRDNPVVFETALRNSTRYKALKAKGMSEEEILTSMNELTKMQIFAYPQEKEVNLSPLDSIKHYIKILNTGFMVMDPKSGHVLAWVGGVNHKYFQYDHVTSQRQVGSTFKPIVYTAALLDGMSPCDYISNERRTYEDYQNWSPANSNGNHEGFYSMKGGLTNSVNTITAEIMIRTGVDKVLNLAEDMGVKSKLPAVPSISLGTGAISLQEMLTVYSCFANEGERCEPVGLLRIEDKNGKVLYEYKEEEKNRVFDRETARLMNYMLTGVVKNGTGRDLGNVYGVKSSVAGKTGTTQDNADGWFIGYTPSLLAGAWVGAESPAVHFRSTALGQGSHMALPIFGYFMQKIEKDPNYRNFTTPDFNKINNDFASSLDCEDYVLTDPDKSFFDLFRFGKRSRPDSTKLKDIDQYGDQQKDRDEKRDGLLKRMRDLFRKKD